MNKCYKTKIRGTIHFDREDDYVLFTTPSLYDDDEVRYILQDIEDSMDKKGIEVIRTTIYI
jgi:hypothetical protein